MRASMAYFAGVGTVVVAVAAGLGGGVLMAGIMNPQGARDVSKLEQRHTPPQAQQSPQPSRPNAAANGSQAPVPYLAATQQAATTPVVISPAPSSSPQPRNEASSASPSAAHPAAPAEAKTENTEKTTSSDPANKPAQASTPNASQQGSSPEDAYAKADVKRKADRAARRQQWTARRQQQREQELRDVEAQVREDTGPGGDIIVRRDDRNADHHADHHADSWRDSWRDDSDRPMRMDFPRFNLFGQD